MFASDLQSGPLTDVVSGRSCKSAGQGHDHTPVGDVPSGRAMGGIVCNCKAGPTRQIFRTSHRNNIIGYNDGMGRNTRYPYHQWIDGEWHDVDPALYGKTIATLRATLHQYANAHGYNLLTVNLDGKLSIRFLRSSG